jgi:hypothetical protein
MGTEFPAVILQELPDEGDQVKRCRGSTLSIRFG